MVDTIDRPAETASSSPEVTSDEPVNINTPVTVSPSPCEPGTFSHDLPFTIPVSAPENSNWTLTWTLLSSGGLSPTFNDPGIVIKEMPEGIHPHQVTKISPTEYKLTFTSHVTDVNTIVYNLDLHVQNTEQDVELKLSKDIVIDPTIAVVKEPLG